MNATLPIQVPNQFLGALSDDDRSGLLDHCIAVELAFAEVLYHSGERIAYIYFPTGSFISLVMAIEGHANLEVGLVGNEGVLGITTALGVDTAPFEALVQGAGSAWCISVPTILQALQSSPTLTLQLHRYIYVSLSQLAQTAACTRFHLVEARLARWLLMTQDRAHSAQFHITHVFLASMLGVRRVGITKAANALLKKNLIRYTRGAVTILDRAGLERAACSCYASDNACYQLIMG